MGFANELKDFAAGLKSGVQMAGQIEQNRVSRFKHPTDSMIEATPSSYTPGTGGGVGTTSASGGNEAFAKQAYAHYRSKGLNHITAAGIVGNLMQESGGAEDVLSGARMGDGGASGYAAQWQGVRLQNLLKFAQSRGHEKPTVEDQLDFVLEEGNAQSPFAEKGAVSALQQMASAPTVEMSTKLFQDLFERPNPEHANFDNRVRWASNLQDTGGGSGGGFQVAAQTAAPAQPTKAIPDDTQTADASEVEPDQVTTGSVNPVIEAPAAPDATPVEPELIEETEFRRGGAIPEMSYAEGGMVDPYYSGRGFTQALTPDAAGPTGAVRAPKFGTADNSTWRSWGSGSPSQTTYRANMAALAQPAAAAPAQPAAAAPAQNAAPTAIQTQLAKARYMRYGQPWEGSGSHGSGGRQQEISQERNINRLTKARKAEVAKGGYHAEGGMVGYAGGGAVPNFKGWQERETTMASRGDGDQEARDRAARRMNMREKGIDSTAYKDRTNEFPARPAAPKQRAKPKGKPGKPSEGKPAQTLRMPAGTPTLPYEPKQQPKKRPDYVPEWNEPNIGQPNAPASLPAPDVAPEYVPEWGAEPTITVPGTEPKKFARGGAIPDDDQPLGRSDRAQSANYQRGKNTKAKGDPWAGLRTKSSTPVKKRKAKPGNREAGKKGGTPKKPSHSYQSTPDRGPVPGGRPQQQPDQSLMPPIPQPRPEPPQPLRMPSTGVTQPSPPQAQPAGTPTEGYNPGRIPSTGQTIPSPPLRQPAGTPPGQYGLDKIPQPYAGGGPGDPGGPGGAPPSFMEIAGSLYKLVSGGGSPSQQAPPGTGAPTKPVSTDPGWPPSPQPGVRKIPGFARGGAIPDEGGPYPNWQAEEASYTSSSADPNVVAATTPRQQLPAQRESPPDQPMAPQPADQGVVGGREPIFQTRDVAAQASQSVDAGLRGLQRLLGIGRGGGAVHTPESQQRSSQGAQRLSRGEGAATREELQAIDQTIGLDQQQMNEGTKNLIRIDKTVQYYLQHGMKDQAEAAGASLLQYGHMQVQRAGVVAMAAFQHWQQTGDPQDLQNATQAVKRAYSFIPDGSDVSIDVDPKTRQLVASFANEDGTVKQQVIDPRAVPDMLGKMIDGSAYWKSMYQIGQPQMALQEGRQKQADAVNQQRVVEEQRRFERGEDAKIAGEERTAARKLWEIENVGGTAGERSAIKNKAWFDDWAANLAAAQTPEEKVQLTTEGMGHRWDVARDRQQPINEGDLDFATKSEPFAGYEEADRPALVNIGRAIAQKNGVLDATGAMTMTDALIKSPTPPTVNEDGALSVQGNSLVFNPALLPQLKALRKKYGQTQ